MIHLTSNREPAKLAARICDLLYGVSERCHPDPAPKVDEGWMVGQGNNVWLCQDDDEPGHFRLVFRARPEVRYLEALVTLLEWRHIAQTARFT